MMAKQVYGERGSVVTRIFIISYQIGKCTAYLIFFMKFFAHVWQDADEV